MSPAAVAEVPPTAANPPPVETKAPPPKKTGADRIRQTAQWMVASFGAVAGALIVSLKLSDIGTFSGDDQFWAIVGFGIGIVGVVVAIVAMAWVMEPFTTGLSTFDNDTKLKQRAEDRDWLAGFKDFDSLATAYRSAATERVEAYNELLEADTANNADAKQVAEKKLDRAEKTLELANPAVARCATNANDAMIVHKWRRALVFFVAGVLTIGIGVAIFAAQHAPEDPATDVVIERPTRVTVNLSPDASDTFAERLGAACDLNSFAATATDSTGKTTTLLVTDPDCTPVELSLTSSEADIVAEPVAIRSPGRGPTDPNATG